MKRLKEEYLDTIESIVSLNNKKVLEVGCGSGSRTVAIAERCAQVQAIEPDPHSLDVALRDNSRANINYQQGTAEHLPFSEDVFDVIIFTLSLHHVPEDSMHKAIDEAVRVTKTGGYVIFLEPAFDGTYFDSEILFDAGCGDERVLKAHAYYTMLAYKNYSEIAEMADETIFEFTSVEDYIETFKPKKNLDTLSSFLEEHNFTLNAKRRINIFSV